MSTHTKKDLKSNNLVTELLSVAEGNSKCDCRSGKPVPFFHPVAIHVGEDDVSAFSRDIGPCGMGLLHQGKLPLREVSITIAGRPQKLRFHIEWFAPSGDNWYISGGRFVGTGE